jgi:hypothetical protein
MLQQSRKDRYDQEGQLIRQRERESFQEMMFNRANRRAQAKRRRAWELDSRE